MNTRNLKWRKASFSDPNGQCVELAESESVLAMRDSKLGDDSPILGLSRSELKAFVQGIKAGELDHFQ